MRKMRREPTSIALFLKEDYMIPFGISQETLAHELGISQAYLSKILEEDAPIDEALSLLLSKRFGVDEDFWKKVGEKHCAWKKEHGISNFGCSTG